MFPIILLSLLGIITLFLGFLKNKKILLPASLVFVLATMVSFVIDAQSPIISLDSKILNNMIFLGGPILPFSIIILLTTALVIIMAGKYVEGKNAQPAEYFAILMFSAIGAILMSAFNHLIMLFLGVEILSISMYVLAGAEKRNLRSNEAAMKYFLMGSFATGFLLMGVALIYGGTGSFFMMEIFAKGIFQAPSTLTIVGAAFLLVGVLFKVSAVPFHFWTADVYQGTPTLFTAFMSTVVKTAGFAALLKIIMVLTFVRISPLFAYSIAGITALTLLVPNLTALNQSSFKRMMAFSGISHAGYLMLVMLVPSMGSIPSVIIYSLAYSVATVMAFAVLLEVELNGGDESFEAFNGLGKRAPLLAFGGTVAMLSLAGIPLTAGFVGKLFIFKNFLETAQSLSWFIVIPVLASAMAMYYYLKLPIAMYMQKSALAEKPIEVSMGTQIVIWVGLILTIVLGVAPGLLEQLLK